MRGDNTMFWLVIWRHKCYRVRHYGYVKADSANEAFDIAAAMLQNEYQITAVYKAGEPTPQSLCLNFTPPEYTLSG